MNILSDPKLGPNAEEMSEEIEFNRLTENEDHSGGQSSKTVDETSDYGTE